MTMVSELLLPVIRRRPPDRLSWAGTSRVSSISMIGRKDFLNAVAMAVFLSEVEDSFVALQPPIREAWGNRPGKMRGVALDRETSGRIPESHNFGNASRKG